MTSCAVVVVGHVDHGKTSLVRALTGQETDRLIEERARGLSIVPGFAHRAYGTGVVDFIDCPGHEDFIGAMASGASGAQSALIVISAVDGIEAQTLEHLDFLEHLGVRQGIVAITKADLCPGRERSEIELEFRSTLSGAFDAKAPFVFCSSLTGEGLTELNLAIEDLIHRSSAAEQLLGAYLPLDRVFSVKGAGTVVTGTLKGKAIHAGEKVMLFPLGSSTSIRGLQVRGHEVPAAQPGMRVAINLRGVSRERLARGDVLAQPDTFSPSHQIDVWFEAQSDQAALSHGESVRVLIGAGSRTAVVSTRDTRSPIGVKGGYARLRFREPVSVFAKQRGIIRRLSPAGTLGGFVVLDPVPAPQKRLHQTRLSVLAAVKDGQAADIACALVETGKGVACVEEFHRLSNVDFSQLTDRFDVIDDGYFSTVEIIDVAKDALMTAVHDAFVSPSPRVVVSISEVHEALRKRFATSLLSYAERQLVHAGELQRHAYGLSLPGRDPFSGLGKARMERLSTLESDLRLGGLSPPALAALQGERGRNADLVELLVGSGRAVYLRNVALKQTLLFHSEALEDAVQRLTRAFPPPRQFSMSEARRALQTSRKYAVPLLEHFDKIGLTKRSGNVRFLVSEVL